METPIEEKGMWETDDSDLDHGIKMRHREAFMAKAFPIELGIKSHTSVQVQSGSTKTCRPQSEVDYIIHVINHWEKGTEVNKLPPGPDRDRLVQFRRQHRAGNKYVHQYFTEEVWAPGDALPRTVPRKYNKDGTPGRIIVSREQLFDAIDEWHQHCGYLGQERTWKYCKAVEYD